MPFFKGIYCRKANHLGYRNVIPGIDKDSYGNFKDEKQKWEVAIVRIKDCRLYEKDGRKYYDPKDAPAIPASNGASWYAYGKARKRNECRWFWFEDEKVLVDLYFTTPFYAVHDSIVYQGAIRHLTPPISYFLEEGFTHKESIKLANEYKPHIK